MMWHDLGEKIQIDFHYFNFKFLQKKTQYVSSFYRIYCVSQIDSNQMEQEITDDDIDAMRMFGIKCHFEPVNGDSNNISATIVYIHGISTTRIYICYVPGIFTRGVRLPFRIGCFSA